MGVYLEWGDWGVCSTSCPGGVQRRIREHTCGATPEAQSQFCGFDAGFGQWSEWTDCSVSCGVGSKYKRRFHICGTKEAEVQVE